MNITVLKSKIHNAFVTDANVDYIGSVTIDPVIMEAVNIIEGEQVHIINHANGERLITYTIAGKRGSREICINGPAALKIKKGDKVIIIAYGAMEEKEARRFKPSLVFPDHHNNLNKREN
jgi:aspartate 1-decarboxylase